eukprot:401937-Amphidinium_carterae.1
MDSHLNFLSFPPLPNADDAAMHSRRQWKYSALVWAEFVVKSDTNVRPYMDNFSFTVVEASEKDKIRTSSF